MKSSYPLWTPRVERATRTLDWAARVVGFGRLRPSKPLDDMLRELYRRHEGRPNGLPKYEVEAIARMWIDIAAERFDLNWQDFLDVGGEDEDDTARRFAELWIAVKAWRIPR